MDVIVREDAPAPSLSIDGQTWQTLRGPGVYIWMRDATPMYVGSSLSLGSRAFSLAHHQLASLRVALGDVDRLMLYTTTTVLEARELERQMIRRVRPELNRTWPYR